MVNSYKYVIMQQILSQIPASSASLLWAPQVKVGESGHKNCCSNESSAVCTPESRCPESLSVRLPWVSLLVSPDSKPIDLWSWSKALVLSKNTPTDKPLRQYLRAWFSCFFSIICNSSAFQHNITCCAFFHHRLTVHFQQRGRLCSYCSSPPASGSAPRPQVRQEFDCEDWRSLDLSVVIEIIGPLFRWATVGPCTHLHEARTGRSSKKQPWLRLPEDGTASGHGRDTDVSSPIAGRTALRERESPNLEMPFGCLNRTHVIWRQSHSLSCPPVFASTPQGGVDCGKVEPWGPGFFASLCFSYQTTLHCCGTKEDNHTIFSLCASSLVIWMWNTMHLQPPNVFNPRVFHICHRHAWKPPRPAVKGLLFVGIKLWRTCIELGLEIRAIQHYFRQTKVYAC